MGHQSINLRIKLGVESKYMTLKVITSLVLCFSVYCVFNTSILIQCVVKDSEILASDLKKT